MGESEEGLTFDTTPQHEINFDQGDRLRKHRAVEELAEDESLNGNRFEL